MKQSHTPKNKNEQIALQSHNNKAHISFNF
jgi:hypothetical protein